MLAFALLVAAPAVAAPALPEGALRVQRVELVDRQGFDKPLVAATMMVPAGWQAQAGVAWNIQQRCIRPYHLQLRAQAPDGSGAIELAGGDGWGQSSTGAVADCPRAAWRDTQQYLAAWVERHRPGARWLDYRARPDKSRPEQRQAYPDGSALSQRVEAGQALIAYSHNGREVRETLATVVAHTQSRVAYGGGRFVESLQGEAVGVLAWRAPAGTLDFKHFDAVWDTLQPGPEWKARMDKANAEMAADNQRTQAEINRIHAETRRETLAHMALRSQIRAQTQRELADIQSGTWRARQDSNDRMHTETVRAVREVQAYRDPRTGGTVELSHHYRHAWQLRDGSYVLTDSASFNPSRDLGISGVQLDRTR